MNKKSIELLNNIPDINKIDVIPSSYVDKDYVIVLNAIDGYDINTIVCSHRNLSQVKEIIEHIKEIRNSKLYGALK